ncbi:MAG: hypothetical protein ACJ72D_19425 [Marmoricola sp.]
MRTRLIGALTGAALLAPLAGCGVTVDTGDGPVAARSTASSGASGDRLTRTQLRSALLGTADVGKGFAEDPHHIADSFYIDCLVGFDDLTGMPHPHAAETRYIAADTDDGAPATRQSVAEYGSVSDARNALSRYALAMHGCGTAKDHDGRDFVHLRVDANDQRTISGVDQETNVAATGADTFKGEDYDQGIWTTAVRVGRYVAVVTYVDADVKEYGVVDGFGAALLSRLDAVIDRRPVQPMHSLDLEVTEFEDGPHNHA